MHIIFVTDIFGKTHELEHLTNLVGGQSEIIDPYSGRLLDFENESEAYLYFMNAVGLNKYCNILITKLQQIDKPTILVGFSIGASVLWKTSNNLNTDFITKLICFYGSRIRLEQEISPCIPVELILPKFEPSFDIVKFAKTMSGKSNVNVQQTSFLHGFMNQLSQNFNHIGYKQYTEWIRKNNQK